MTSKVSENNQTLQCCTISLFCIIIFKKTKTYGSEKTQHKVLKAIIFFFLKPSILKTGIQTGMLTRYFEDPKLDFFFFLFSKF